MIGKVSILKNICKNKKGFSMVEILVSIGIFAVMMVSIMHIFSMSMVAQQRAIVSKQLQENIRYAFESISKEIRMARVDYDGVCVPANTVYWTDGDNDEIYFLNQYQECVHYFKESNRFKIERGSKPAIFVTPSDLDIEKLKFITLGSVPLEQPQITVMIEASPTLTSLSEININLQTTLSTRHYE